MSLLWLVPAAAVLSAALTGLWRRYALSRGILDIPNARSAHRTPTPRGGGVAIAATFLAVIAVLWAEGAMESRVALALAGPGSLVAMIGFLDDRASLPAWLRLVVHFAAAGLALALLGGLPPLIFGTSTVDLSWPGHIGATLYLVWLLNLYNFMDGIDGLAALETVTVTAVAAVLYGAAIFDNQSVVVLALGASAFGFLCWNWPQARVFMGDAGSGFLGLTLGLLSIRAASADPRFLAVWIILLGVFIADATITLLQRIGREEPVHVAHDDHAYQHAARRAGHQAVTLGTGAINLLWLAPLAGAAASGWIDTAMAVAIAYLPLVMLTVRLKQAAAFRRR